jgi:hypothetical protein
MRPSGRILLRTVSSDDDVLPSAKHWGSKLHSDSLPPTSSSHGLDTSNISRLCVAISPIAI